MKNLGTVLPVIALMLFSVALITGNFTFTVVGWVFLIAGWLVYQKRK